MPLDETTFRQKVPEDLGSRHIFHYTDAQGLLGIIESNTLWAFDIRSMNDEQEYFYGRRLAEKQLEAIASKQTDPSARERAHWLLDRLGSINEAIHIPTYVASFSENPDLLSQWRAYCRGGGFSIGFDAESLRKLASTQGFVLEPCIYDDAEQNRRIAASLHEGHVLDSLWRSDALEDA